MKEVLLLRDLSLTKREKMVYSGKKFEIIVASQLSSIFNYPILLNRQFLDRRIGKGMECDLVLVTSFKIYCIECKNYSGYIAGNMFDEKWRFSSSGRKGKVQNPYLLNKRRIRVIRGKFYENNYNPPKIENLIVVPDNCNIHVDYKAVYNLTDFINIVKIDSVTNKDVYRTEKLSEFLVSNSRRREG